MRLICGSGASLSGCLLLLIALALAQPPEEQPGELVGHSPARPIAGFPDTPEQPGNDVHVDAPPVLHPDIVEGPVNAVPVPHAEIIKGNLQEPAPDPPPAPPIDQIPPLAVDIPADGTALVPPQEGALGEIPPPPPPPSEGVPDVGGPPPPPSPPEGEPDVGDPSLPPPPPPEGEPGVGDPPPPPPPPPAEGVPPSPEEYLGPFNAWRTPSPGEPAIEVKAGTGFNYTWTPNTEGVISLELWQIENNAPVPKYLIASEIENTGLYEWVVHRNFPQGTGYCLVIVPPDRNHASLSPLFTILGDTDYEMPLPINPEHIISLKDLDVNKEGTHRTLFIALGIGFVVCNLFAIVAWFANDREGSLRDSHAIYSTLEKNSGKRVFHARNPSTMVAM